MSYYFLRCQTTALGTIAKRSSRTSQTMAGRDNHLPTHGRNYSKFRIRPHAIRHSAYPTQSLRPRDQKAINEDTRRPTGDRGLLNNLGTLYLIQQHFAEGLEVFQETLAIDSTDALIWNKLGTSFLRRRQFTESQHWLEGAVKRRPEDSSLRLKLADAYRGTGAIEPAREMLKKHSNSRPKTSG